MKTTRYFKNVIMINLISSLIAAQVGTAITILRTLISGKTSIIKGGGSGF